MAATITAAIATDQTTTTTTLPRARLIGWCPRAAVRRRRSRRRRSRRAHRHRRPCRVRRRAFSLVELIVAVTIMAILAALVV
ncbi:MAG: prepilin-type N-terminal cleavage/methylation domain-containing protein, partial [Phycisphaerales bacterium]